MNIFVLEYRKEQESLYDWCKRIAHSHCDQHTKLVLEAWQQLNTGCNILGIETDSISVAYQNHPCTVWVRQTLGNWRFCVEYAHALSDDMAERRGHDRVHGSSQRIVDNVPYDANGLLPDGMTQFAMAMPEHLKLKYADDPIAGYREYYCKYKSWFVRKTKQGLQVYPSSWAHGDIPKWYKRPSLMHTHKRGRLKHRGKPVELDQLINAEEFL